MHFCLTLTTMYTFENTINHNNLIFCIGESFQFALKDIKTNSCPDFLWYVFTAHEQDVNVSWHVCN